MGGVVLGLVGAGRPPQFANDLGPETVDVSGYPKVIQEGYAVFAKKCASCHSLSRAINSSFIELSDLEKTKAVKAQPLLGTDPRIWKMEPDIWRRYVKRMAYKPGSTIAPSEAMRIYAFLVYDSKARKMGARAKEWQAQRTRFLEDFQKLHPVRFQELYKKEGPPQRGSPEGGRP